MRHLLASLLLALTLFFAAPAWASTVDVNTATSAELQTLPGIGPAKAQAIIDHRTQNGPFATVDQLDDVSGIGPATLANIRALVTVGGGEAPPAAASAAAETSTASTATASAPAGPTVDINSADLSGLQNLPGIGPAKAQAILDDRTQNGPFASCQALTRVNGIGDATVARLAASCVAN